MLAILQRVSEASVTIQGEVSGAIKQGFLVLLGIETIDEARVEQLNAAFIFFQITPNQSVVGAINGSLKEIPRQYG